MNVPIPIIGIFLTALVGLQGWTLLEIVALKTQVAALKAKMEK
jgi:hypothetical protein